MTLTYLCNNYNHFEIYKIALIFLKKIHIRLYYTLISLNVCNIFLL